MKTTITGQPAQRSAWAREALWWARLILAAFLAVTAGAMAEAWAGTGWLSRTDAVLAAAVVFLRLHPGLTRKEMPDA